MYAVIITGGKQYRVVEGDTLKVEKLSAEDKDQVLRFAEFLAAAGTPPRRKAAAPESEEFADPVIDPGPVS